jgi:hypothetical protein
LYSYIAALSSGKLILSELRESENEKVALEHQAAKLFMHWYEHDTGKQIRHLWHNRPNKPDVSCRLEGQRLDLEIAHLYGSEQEAMEILGRDLTPATRDELRALNQTSEPNKRLLNALNRILYNKSLKHYTTEQVWLIIRNAHPSWSKTQIIELRQRIDIPKNHPFEQIWIVGDWAGKTGIVKLYP